MHNLAYEPETDFVPTAPVTEAQAMELVKKHETAVKRADFDINKPSDRYSWECLNYFNQIILKSRLKK